MDKKIFGKYENEYVQIALKANEIHNAVNQEYDGKAYIWHLKKVADYAIKFLPDECEKDIVPVLFGAFFHDSIEDARLTYNDVMKIAKEYMDDDDAYLATEIVYALTNEKGRNRHERANYRYYQGIRACPYAPLVKAADRLANYSYAKETKSKMEKCYREEMEDFVKMALTAEDGALLVPKEMVDELFS